MTVTGQKGFFGYGPQTGKGVEATTLYRHKAYNIDYGTIEDNRQFPQEVGGTIVPTGAFKTGVRVGGGARITPRLEADFGWLMYAAMGSATSANNSPEAGLRTHTFFFDPDDDSNLPWMTVYKYIPGSTSDTDMMEAGLDNKVVGLEITIPQAGLVTAQVVFAGREPTFEFDPDTSGFQDFEEYPSVPISAKGALTWDGGAIPVLGCVISLANNINPDEQIVGSYFPDDVLPLSRQVVIRFTYKWADPDMYMKILTGEANGTAWSPVPKEAAFHVEVESPGDIDSFNNPYKLQFDAARVTWRVDGPVELAGGQMLVQNYVGIVQENPDGNYATFKITNEQANYLWPS